jgi:hypothetical protein
MSVSSTVDLEWDQYIFSETVRLVIIPHIHSGKPAGQVTDNIQDNIWLSVYVIMSGCNNVRV